MKKLCCLAVLGLFSASAFAYDSLDDLLAAQQLQEVAAIKEYIASHPEAADIGDAQDRLIMGLMASDQNGEALPIMLKRYEALIHGNEAELRVLFGHIVPSVIQTYSETGRKKDARDFIERVRKDFSSHDMAENVSRMLDTLAVSLNKPAVGDTMDISFEATDGRKVNLADLKGKVVLVDYWATWCGPCKVELPNVIAAYNKHHEAGFEIIGISLDKDAEKLKTFVTEQNMSWPQFFDGKGWLNAQAQKYGIQSIPATFLVGKDGKIAATDLRGDALEKKVAELLAN